MHTSLYRVEYLSFKSENNHSLANMWRIHQEPEFDSTDEQKFNSKVNYLKEKYIWGVEIIQGLKTNSIDKLTISEEVTYF